MANVTDLFSNKEYSAPESALYKASFLVGAKEVYEEFLTSLFLPA